ncbi:Trp biosynthesis-associated membrane protein [Thermobispora bispora]|uniref:Trp biosynthesis associated, transmembrane protein, Oprn/Chp n=1 Tax=Thermobispora bispora (strain ATCC 19993 / DSM 43833 / CBS 139.67 / JCM 10125 / KCTC 9307 / NBRC 14880 / R51) TaxID=469371 RepID=D6YA22_THEBD|nr:Trp biosynthesis-associated membrane protein [Thermobispora bispora]ADG88165.1 trp region conserved hypothetical protein [Thermobispora bispora DSM 43833]
MTIGGTSRSPARGEGAGTTARAARRAPLIWLVCCAAGAGLVLFAAGRTWATVAFPSAGPRPVQVALTGADLAASLTAAVLAALAAAVAVFAARGIARKAVAAVLALCGIAIAAACRNGVRVENAASVAREHVTAAVAFGGAPPEVSVASGWPIAAVAGGVVLFAAGVAAIVLGGRWPGLSSRFDRPDARRTRGGRAGSGGRNLWDAIDRGEDPTAGQP